MSLGLGLPPENKLKMGYFTYSILILLYVTFYFYSTSAPLAEFKDIAQAPKTGVHQYRIGGVSLVDVAATLIVSVIIGYFTGWNVAIVSQALLFISVPVHMLFGVNTALIEWINENLPK